jgi:hypothetical protein
MPTLSNAKGVGYHQEKYWHKSYPGQKGNSPKEISGPHGFQLQPTTTTIQMHKSKNLRRGTRKAGGQDGDSKKKGRHLN